MLNELHDLAQSLSNLNVTVESWHQNFKPCPKGSATYLLLIDSSPSISDLEVFGDRERVAATRKWEVAAGVSFPAFNVLPLYEPCSDDDKKTATALRKELLSKNPPECADTRERLARLMQVSKSLWTEKELVRVSKCIATLGKELEVMLGTPPDQFRSISELIVRTENFDAAYLHSRFTEILAAKLADRPADAGDWFDTLFFHSGKTAKRWSVIAELADRSAFEYPATHIRVQSWMNARFQESNHRIQSSHYEAQTTVSDAYGLAADRMEDSFPAVRLPVLGNVILRSMSKESPCQRRYDVADSQSCRVGQLSRQAMKNSLEWIADPGRRDRTWSDVSNLSGGSAVLFAYPSALNEVDAELAGLIVGLAESEDPDGARFSACASRVISSLNKLTAESPTTEIRVFVLTKPDGFRTKVLNTACYTPERIVQSASDWHEGCANIPHLMIRQFGATKGDKAFWAHAATPYPGQLVQCLNTVWERSGTHATQIHSFGIGDGLALLLDRGSVLQATVKRALRSLVSNSLSLILALGQAHNQGRAHPVGKKDANQPVMLPCVFGLLLAKLGRVKGEYMTGPPFLVGRLLSLADQLHVQYCHGVRKGQIPPQLAGNALMTTAMDSPQKAVVLLWQRIKPYYSWAQTVQGGDEVRLAKYFVGQLGKVSSELKDTELPTRCSDPEKAELLLGYLARAEKDNHASSPSTIDSESASV